MAVAGGFQLVMMRRLDIVVLIVADTDYTPLLRKLMSFGVRVMLLKLGFRVYYRRRGADDYQNFA